MKINEITEEVLVKLREEGKQLGKELRIRMEKMWRIPPEQLRTPTRVGKK